jgi:hypothetical protein
VSRGGRGRAAARGELFGVENEWENRECLVEQKKTALWWVLDRAATATP